MLPSAASEEDRKQTIGQVLEPCRLVQSGNAWRLARRDWLPAVFQRREQPTRFLFLTMRTAKILIAILGVACGLSLAYSTWQERRAIIADKVQFSINVPGNRKSQKLDDLLRTVNTDTPEMQAKRLADRQPYGTLLFAASALLVAGSLALGTSARR